MTVRASGVRSGDLALVGESYASVIKLSGDLVSLQVFAGTQGVSTTDTVRFLGRPMMVSFSDDLLGRVFDGAGVPARQRPRADRKYDPHRRALRQPRQAHRAQAHDPHPASR